MCGSAKVLRPVRSPWQSSALNERSDTSTGDHQDVHIKAEALTPHYLDPQALSVQPTPLVRRTGLLEAAYPKLPMRSGALLKSSLHPWQHCLEKGILKKGDDQFPGTRLGILDRSRHIGFRRHFFPWRILEELSGRINRVFKDLL